MRALLRAHHSPTAGARKARVEFGRRHEIRKDAPPLRPDIAGCAEQIHRTVNSVSGSPYRMIWVAIVAVFEDYGLTGQVKE